MLLLQHFKYKLQLDIQRPNNLSINFYLVLHKMWYFFSTELKMPQKNFLSQINELYLPTKISASNCIYPDSQVHQTQCHVTYIISVVQHPWHQEGSDDVTDRRTRTPYTKHQTTAKTYRGGFISDYNFRKYLALSSPSFWKYSYQLLVEPNVST